MSMAGSTGDVGPEAPLRETGEAAKDPGPGYPGGETPQDPTDGNVQVVYVGPLLVSTGPNSDAAVAAYTPPFDYLTPQHRS